MADSYRRKPPKNSKFLCCVVIPIRSFCSSIALFNLIPSGVRGSWNNRIHANAGQRELSIFSASIRLRRPPTRIVFIRAVYRIVSYWAIRYDTIRPANDTIRYGKIRYRFGLKKGNTRYDTMRYAQTPRRYAQLTIRYDTIRPKKWVNTYRLYRSYRIVAYRTALVMILS